MTHYYSLKGTLTRDGEPITDREEISEIVVHWMRAADAYPHAFVDADADATLRPNGDPRDPIVSFNWSDYGQPADRVREGEG